MKGLLFVLVVVSWTSLAAHQLEFPVQACQTALVSGHSWPCIKQLAENIYAIHQWSENSPVNICGMSCIGNLKGRISKWKWKWDGRFRCPAKVPGIEGSDTKLSRNGAMEWAIKDFLQKAIQSGRINPKDFHC